MAALCSRSRTSRSTSRPRTAWCKAVDGISYTVDRGETFGIVGESGSGKSVSSLTVMGLTRARNARITRHRALRRQGPARRVRGRPAQDPRQRHRDDLPGPAVLAAPLLQGRDADRRGRARAPRRLEGAGLGPRGRDALAGRHPGAAQARRRLPARVLGRHAPARDDRDGAGQRPEAADRRRADDRARRDRPGADPRADRDAAERVRHRGRRHHPRPRRRRRDGRRDRGHVRRPDRREGRHGHDLRGARAPLHVGAAVLDPAAGLAARRGARADLRPPAVADQPAGRLLVPPALPVRARGAQARSTRSSSRCPGSPSHEVACLLAPETRRKLWSELQQGIKPDDGAPGRDGRRRPYERRSERGHLRPRRAGRDADGGPRPLQALPDPRRLLPPPGRRGQGRRRRLLRRHARRDARARGRVRLRQVDHRAAAAAPAGPDRRLDQVRRPRDREHQGRRAEGAAPRDADDLPGPVLVAEPAQDGRHDHLRPVRHPRHQADQGRAQDRPSRS